MEDELNKEFLICQFEASMSNYPMFNFGKSFNSNYSIKPTEVIIDINQKEENNHE